MTQSSQTISPLRQRMIDDMTLRKLNPKIQDAYIRSVIKLTVFLRRSPDSASPENLRRFQLHLASAGVSNTSINATITGCVFSSKSPWTTIRHWAR
jgi:integrase/recombinase XerD